MSAGLAGGRAPEGGGSGGVLLTHVRIKRVARDENAQAWAAALGSDWAARAEVLKEEAGSSWVRRATLQGREVVVKARLLDRLSRRVKSALGAGQGDRQWVASARLAMKRIAAARPLALGRARWNGRPVEVLVLEYVPGETLLAFLGRCAGGEEAPPVRVQHAVAAAAGRSITALLDADLYNRDHKPSNLVLAGSGEGKVVMIDCVGVRRLFSLDGFESHRMAASLVIEPTGCGVRPRRALWMRGLVSMAERELAGLGREERREHVRALVASIAGLVAAHGDPRPRVRPGGSRE